MKKLMLFGIFATLCLTLSLGSGVVMAQALHDRADADKDGIVTKADIMKALEERYKSEDANKDGNMTVDEYQQARKKNFDDADTNKDGVVGIEEWVVYWCGTDKDAAKVKKPVKMGKKASRAKLMDANKDGKISKNECVAFWGGRFVDLDGNKDGKMSRDEYMEKMKGMAKMMDLNGDGVIVIEEYYVSWLGKDKVTIKNKPAGKAKKSPAEKAPEKK